MAVIPEYSATLFKQERMGKKLQDVEKIKVKMRHSPKAMHMKWVDGPFKGREVLYNEKLYGAGNLRVRESGILGMIAVTMSQESFLAGRGTNHLVTELGLKYLLDLVVKDFTKGYPLNEIARKNRGVTSLDGTRVYVTEYTMPDDKKKGYYCYKIVLYTDFVRSILVKSDVYLWDDQLYESYYYTDITLDPKFTDADFDPKNPDYKL
jgi:hypothetical protein